MFGMSILAKYAAMGLAALVIVGAAWGYWEWSRAEIGHLKADVALVTKQADDLKAANDKIQHDMMLVQTQIDATNASLQNIRNKSAQVARSIRQQDLKGAAILTPKQVQDQINTDTASTFKGFEDATHAK